MLLLGSMLCGSYILEFFGITIPAVRIAGGVLVACMGWNLRNEPGGAKTNPPPELDTPCPANDRFYPLTLPLTVGPGAISVALTIGAHHPRGALTTHAALVLGSALLGLLALAVTVYATYRLASPLVHCLGSGGVNAPVRLSAFILACIGVQIAWGGLADLIGGLNVVS